MSNFTRGTPRSVINRIKHDSLSLRSHRKVLIIGSGESGYGLLSRMRWQWDFHATHLGVVSTQPIHRVRFGLPLYATGYYLPIDFERPLIKDFKRNAFEFDEVVSVSLEHKSVELFYGPVLTFDYLFLACGRETDFLSLPESFSDHAALETTDVYDLSVFEGYKKLLKRADLVLPQETFKILVMRDSCQLEEALSLALLLRRRFRKNAIKVQVSPQHFALSDKVKESLKRHFARRKIELSFWDAQAATPPNTDGLVLSDFWTLTPEELLLVYPSKKLPMFLETTPDLHPDNFDLHHLTNKAHPNVFALGSYLFPDCGFRSKVEQSNVALANFTARISEDWYEKPVPPRHYTPTKQLSIFDNFAKAYSLQEDRFSKNFLTAKVRAWRLQNSEMFRHLYWQRLKPKHMRAQN